MGTHDLDTIQGPFSYEALPHKEIKFVPLNKDVAVDGDELMELYSVSTRKSFFVYSIMLIMHWKHMLFRRRISISVNSFTSFATLPSILSFSMPTAPFVLFPLSSTLITPRSPSTPRTFSLKLLLLMNTRLALS